jgi:hypothetical protein
MGTIVCVQGKGMVCYTKYFRIMYCIYFGLHKRTRLIQDVQGTHIHTSIPSPPTPHPPTHTPAALLSFRRFMCALWSRMPKTHTHTHKPTPPSLPQPHTCSSAVVQEVHARTLVQDVEREGGVHEGTISWQGLASAMHLCVCVCVRACACVYVCVCVCVCL